MLQLRPGAAKSINISKKKFLMPYQALVNIPHMIALWRPNMWDLRQIYSVHCVNVCTMCKGLEMGQCKNPLV